MTADAMDPAYRPVFSSSGPPVPSSDPPAPSLDPPAPSLDPPAPETNILGSGPTVAPTPTPTRSAMKLLVPVLIGGAVALSLGVYGGLHEGTLVAVNIAGFSGPLQAKVWLATGAFVLALVQLVSALAMYGKLGFHAPSWMGGLHRWSGRIAFLLTVPVAIHCLYALGFESSSPRVLIHSLLGCFFFGVFTVKMLVLSRRGMPGWALPLFGGLVFTGLVGLWLTSSLWFFTTKGVQF